MTKSLFYLPGLDSDVEQILSGCKHCKTYMGCDFLDVFSESYFIIEDYYSKWLELKRQVQRLQIE
ncbi:hypothetical protein PR048_011210 [Dryococelus australis]|uniref:Uncharacterized protein n=1 Tax=Dryococelus australis TaxID=614101 RepID=A0ABQ9HL01_9NEOP|nr:hypothetical protein PR048_011210 [Dryococelus australis]